MASSRPVPPSFPSRPPTGPVAHPPERWAPAPPPTPATAPPPLRAWAAVVTAGFGVLVGVVTAFAPWAEYVDGVELTGVEHGDGWIVLAMVSVGAGLVGALAAGWRHLAVRFGLVAVAVVLFVLFGLNRIDLDRSTDYVNQSPIDAGGGLYGVALAACLVLAGALIIPPRSQEPSPPG